MPTHLPTVPRPYRTPWGRRWMTRRVTRDPWAQAVADRLATAKGGWTVNEIADWAGVPAAYIRVLMARMQAVGMARTVCHDGDTRTPQPEGSS